MNTRNYNRSALNRAVEDIRSEKKYTVEYHEEIGVAYIADLIKIDFRTRHCTILETSQIFIIREMTPKTACRKLIMDVIRGKKNKDKETLARQREEAQPKLI